MLDAGSRAALRTRAVAHRGRQADDPEQAISSLRRLPAWVRAVEVDVRLSADDVPVLMHDKTVDRTTDGRGPVVGLRASELGALSVEPGAGVPTLAAYLEACARRGVDELLLHLKVAREEALAATVADVRAARAEARCVLLVRDVSTARRARLVAPDVRVGLLATTRANFAERLALARSGEVSLLLTPHGDLRYFAEREVIGEARAAGVRVGASTLRSEAAHRAALRDGCDVIVTDRVHALDAAHGAPSGP